MVTALVRLRFRVLANTLRRSPLLLVATILGMVQALALLGIVLVGALILAHDDTPPVMRELVPVIAGSVVLLGWILLPLAVAGSEPTLDPRKLGPFPLTVGALMRALVLVGALWTPGIATAVGLLLSSIVWWRSPIAVVTAVLVAPLLLLLCISASRAVTQLVANLVARHGVLVRVVGVIGVLVVFVTPTVTAVVSGLAAAPPPRTTADEDLRVPAVAAMLADTPLGAPFSIPGHVANGRLGELVAAVVITVGVLIAVLLVWRLGLRHALESGVGSAQRASRQGLGVFVLLPASPAGAITGRLLVSWARDPRYSRQLVILPVLPVLLVVFAVVIHQPAFAYAAAPAVAGLLPLSQFAALSFDGTAYTSQLSAPVSGRADRLGRTVALLFIVAPVIVLIAMASLAAVGALSALPAVLGLSLGAMLAALAVSAVSSALVVVPVPAIGQNPFGSVSGASTTNVVGSYVVTLLAAVAMLPVLVLGTVSILLDSAPLGWATLVAAVLWGGALLVTGIEVGGRQLDRRGPLLLARLARFHGS